MTSLKELYLGEKKFSQIAKLVSSLILKVLKYFMDLRKSKDPTFDLFQGICYVFLSTISIRVMTPTIS